MGRRAACCVLAVAFLPGLQSATRAQTVSWTSTGGPGGGEVHELARDSAGRLFATVVRAGVFRSDDGGGTWAEANNGLWTASAGPILVLPGDRLLLAVGNHIYLSADNGDHWQLQNNTSIGEARRFLRTPTGAVIAASNGQGIFRSVDEGVTWAHALDNEADPSLPDAYVMDVAVSASTGHLYAAATWPAQYRGLYVSTDDGVSWALAAGFPDNGTFGVRSVAVLSSGRILANAEGCVPGPHNGDLFSSDDDGATWSLLPPGLSILGCHANSLLEDGSGSVWAPVYQDAGLARSSDGGLTWSEVGLRPKNLNAVLVGPEGRLFVGSSSTGVWRATTAEPSSAAPVNTGLRGANTLAVLPVGGSRLLAGTAFGLSQSEDGGATWRTVASHALGYESQSPCRVVTRASGGALVASVGGFLARSWDEGGTWSVTPTLDPATNQWVGEFLDASAAATGPAGRLYLGGSWGTPGIWVSAGDAATFTRTHTQDVPWGNTPVRALAFEDGVLYVGTKYDGLYRSGDLGQTFEPLAFTGASVGALLASGGVLFAGVAGSGVWRSADQAWTRVYETTSEIYALVENADGALFLAQSGGVVSVSNDRGATWESTAGFDRPGMDVQGLALDAGQYLYAATWAGGVYRSAEPTAQLDTVPPSVSAGPGPLLWPPNGRMVPVAVFGRATDAGTGVAGTTGSYSVIDEYELVQPTGTFTVAGDGTFAFTVLLEARRNGGDLTGRSYAVNVSVHDVAMNWATTAFVVAVSHDRRE